MHPPRPRIMTDSAAAGWLRTKFRKRYVSNERYSGAHKLGSEVASLMGCFRQLKHDGVAGVFTYNTVITLLCEMQRMTMVQKMMHAMAADGIAVCIQAYTRLMAHYCTLGDMDSILKLWREVLKSGEQWDSVQFLSTMLSGFRKAKVTQSIIDKFFNLSIAFVAPDSQMIGVYASSQLNAEDCEAVCQKFSGRLDQNHKLEALLYVCANTADAAAAHRLFAKYSKGVIVTASAYAHYVVATVTNMSQYKTVLQNRPCPLLPSIFTHGICLSSTPKEAMDIFNHCLLHKKSNRGVLSVLYKKLLDLNRPDYASMLMERFPELRYMLKIQRIHAERGMPLLNSAV
eukprot:TRINITY_DN21505_c0_g1_i1.p1 TRINITY_DN21505_c0_g1~~TRINITY_DN21505_c0_g1_i1.p1  ORF type:complete len:362 (+),score=30.75 TRINITY_DN21505_c0_g1_i1:59-1087(+)